MVFILIPLILASFFYKKFIDNRLRIGQTPLNVFNALNPFASYYNFLPIRKEKYAHEFHRLAERGNVALLVFYAAWLVFILII